MKTVQDQLKSERCSLFMIDHEKGELWSSLAQGAGEIRIPMNKGIAGMEKLIRVMLSKNN